MNTYKYGKVKCNNGRKLEVSNGLKMYFYGMDDNHVNTFIISLPYKFQHCINGKGLSCTNQHKENVLVLRSGVADIYIDKNGTVVFNLRQVETSEGIRDEEKEFQEELQLAPKIFIPFGTINLHLRCGSKVKNTEYNATPWDERPISKLKNHGLHQAVLVIERGLNGLPDKWLKFDAMIIKGTDIRKCARNIYYYNTVRKVLLERYNGKWASGHW
ncbi:unnamed protein product [Orchesella dallaii]|uniref:Uncharacterized protein n=1 Tax=Orchesella dallaii TaxID=48710 RepID=A0ABP1R197_9HEXA